MRNFAARLKADRQKGGLTVRQLADLSQISFSYITKIETGRTGSGISSQIVSALAKALGSNELEYLHLSGVVPEPLNGLLADQQTRSVLQHLLEMRSSSPDPVQMQMGLGQRKKSRRKSVA